MNRTPCTSGIFIAVVCLMQGCASLSTSGEKEEIMRHINSRTKMNIVFPKVSPEDKQIVERVESLTKHGLTPDGAVEIALLHNPSFQAVLEELGIAKAEVVQAGLLKNPSLHTFIRKPDHEGKTNAEFEVKQDILDIFLMPLRRKLANAQIEQVKYTIGHAALKLDSDVRAGYYALQSAQQLYAMQEKILKAAQSAAELSERQFKAGNINDLVLSGRQLALYQAQTFLSEQEAAVVEARENLSRFMGLSSDSVAWNIPGELPYIAREEGSLEELERSALADNFDVAAARQDVKVKQRALSVSRLGIVPYVAAGFNTESETDGQRLSGPVFEVEVPLFDRKQSPVARAQAHLRQSEARLKAKKDEVLSEVRSKYAQLLAMRKNVEIYKGKVIPLHARFIDSLQRHYNYMLVGVYDLLNAKKDEVEAIRQFLKSLKEYWVIRSRIEQLAGRHFSFTPEGDTESITQPPKQADAGTVDHHHHGRD